MKNLFYLNDNKIYPQKWVGMLRNPVGFTPQNNHWVDMLRNLVLHTWYLGKKGRLNHVLGWESAGMAEILRLKSMDLRTEKWVGMLRIMQICTQ